MKKIIKILIIGFIFALGYLAGSFYPLSSFSQFSRGNIIGEAELRIIVLREDKTPVQNLEVDVAPKPGPPPMGGAVDTDLNGIANFYLKPGVYAVYFNLNNFPKDLEYPTTQWIKVNKDAVTERTIILRRK